MYFLAVACLETRAELDLDVRQLILERAASLMPPQSLEEAQVIAKAGNPVVQLLVQNPDYSSEEAAYSMEALGQIGTESAIEAITTYVADSRGLVRQAIGRAWSSFDTTDYGNSIVKHCESLYLDEMPSLEELTS